MPDPITNTTRYPVFASKADFLLALREQFEGEMARDVCMELLYRLSNTNTDNWTGDSTVRHDA